MRFFLRVSLLAAVSLAVFAQVGHGGEWIVGLADSVQAEEHIHANLHDKRGLSDILGALGLEGGKKGAKDATQTKTVTVQAAAAKGNATCAAQKTITVTQQAPAAGGTG
jgi:hypothetical protein